MGDQFIENVYETLQGETSPGFRIPGVENAFDEGKKCAILYKEVYDAERRLEERLDVEPYDDDVEKIIKALLDIQKELCFKMYRYGAKFGLRNDYPAEED